MYFSRDEELEGFKTGIDLRDYAAAMGFELVRKKSSRHCSVMQHSCGDKLVISKTRGNHYVYFNVHGGDSGSIIDFVQSREGGSIGKVRQILRNWHGKQITLRSDRPTLFSELQISNHDAGRVLAAWMAAVPLVPGNQYLSIERAIPDNVFSDPIFEKQIRVDGRGNVLFVHRNQSGICGFEIKNRGFTGFSPGGVKGLMHSQPRNSDHEMVVCETAIDLLSFAAISGTEGRRFFSLAGQPSDKQALLLKSAVTKMPDPAKVMLAFDNDDAGNRLADRIVQLLSPVCPNVMKFLPPDPGQDWNDVLTANRNAVSPQPRL